MIDLKQNTLLPGFLSDVPNLFRKGMIKKLRRSVILITSAGVNPRKEINETRFGAIFEGKAENHDKTK